MASENDMKRADFAVDNDPISPERGSINLTAEAAVKAVKAGHAKDVDIAAQIIAEHGHELAEGGWTPAEDKALIKKVDWRLIPIVC